MLGCTRAAMLGAGGYPGSGVRGPVPSLVPPPWYTSGPPWVSLCPPPGLILRRFCRVFSWNFQWISVVFREFSVNFGSFSWIFMIFMIFRVYLRIFMIFRVYLRIFLAVYCWFMTKRCNNHCFMTKRCVNHCFRQFCHVPTGLEGPFD